MNFLCKPPKLLNPASLEPPWSSNHSQWALKWTRSSWVLLKSPTCHQIVVALGQLVAGTELLTPRTALVAQFLPSSELQEVSSHFDVWSSSSCSECTKVLPNCGETDRFLTSRTESMCSAAHAWIPACLRDLRLIRAKHVAVFMCQPCGWGLHKMPVCSICSCFL